MQLDRGQFPTAEVGGKRGELLVTLISILLAPQALVSEKLNQNKQHKTNGVGLWPYHLQALVSLD